MNNFLANSIHKAALKWRIVTGCAAVFAVALLAWHVATQNMLLPIKTFDAPGEQPVNVAFSPDGRCLAVTVSHNTVVRGRTRNNGQAYCFDFMTGRLLWKSQVYQDLTDARFSPDGNLLVCSTERDRPPYGSDMQCFDSKSGKLIRTLSHEQGGGAEFSFILHSSLAAVIGHDANIVTIRDIVTERVAARLPVIRACAAAFSSDGSLLAVTSYAGYRWHGPVPIDRATKAQRLDPNNTTTTLARVELWDWRGRRRLWSQETVGFAPTVCFTHDGQRIAAGGAVSNTDFVPNSWVPLFPAQSAAGIYEARSGKLLHALECQEYIDSLVFSADDRYLALGSARGTLIADEQGTIIKRIMISQGGMTHDSTESYSFSPDGKMLAARGINNVCVWQFHPGR